MAVEPVIGRCRTNLDNCQAESWPTSFAAVPRVGELVMSARGRYLRVCGVSHYEDEGKPRILVELNR